MATYSTTGIASRKFIDSPAVWVFVNKLPDPKYLSPDRWKYYTINCNKELKKYIPTEADFAKGEGSACQRFKGRLPSVTLPFEPYIPYSVPTGETGDLEIQLMHRRVQAQYPMEYEEF